MQRYRRTNCLSLSIVGVAYGESKHTAWQVKTKNGAACVEDTAKPDIPEPGHFLEPITTKPTYGEIKQTPYYTMIVHINTYAIISIHWLLNSHSFLLIQYLLVL